MLKVAEQSDKHSPVSFIVAIFWNGQVKGGLTPLKSQPRPGASLSLSFMTSTASVATMLPSAPPFLL